MDTLTHTESNYTCANKGKKDTVTFIINLIDKVWE